MVKLLDFLPLVGGEGKFFVISAPSGAGKNTLVNLLSQRFSNVEQSVSCTTRAPREGEKQGQHYEFLSEKEFKEKIKQGAFFEYVHLFDHYYGLTKKNVFEKTKNGTHIIAVLDVQGVLQLQKMDLPAVYIFLSPPSLSVLRDRLRARGTEKEEVIEKRLAEAGREMSHISLYDYVVVNDDISITEEVLSSILLAEVHRQRRREHG